MSVTVSPMQHSYQLVDNFQSLDHWSEYGANERSYELVHDQAIDVGGALLIGSSGVLRLARQTHLVPGDPIAVTLWLWADAQRQIPCAVRIGEQSGEYQDLVPRLQDSLVRGWNSVVVNFTPPAEWDRVRLALFTTSADGGLIGPIRAVPAVNADD